MTQEDTPNDSPNHTYPPPPPPPGLPWRRRGLVITAIAALAVGGGLGAIINTSASGPSGTATATSSTSLTASEIARRVDPGLVDIVSVDGKQQTESAGTGIVLTASGEILTNNHVIEGATSITVTDVGNGKTYSATVVGYDASSDVAVLQLHGASGLTTASLGDSGSVSAGDTVTALGNAAGRGGTPSVASGTVTALNQAITASDELSGTGEQLTGLIESDAPIQAGDSGGPLVNSHGEVIGMDTAASSSYQFQGQSTATAAYSIPINTAIAIARQIEAGQASATVHIGATAFLGVGIATQGQGFGDPLGSGTGSGTGSGGAYLSVVEAGSPAAGAGLVAGDTITSLGGQAVSSGADVQKILVRYHPGDSIQIGWTDQNGQSHTATLTLATGPAA